MTLFMISAKFDSLYIFSKSLGVSHCPTISLNKCSMTYKKSFDIVIGFKISS